MAAILDACSDALLYKCMIISLVFLARFLGRIVKLQYTRLCMSLHVYIFIHIRANIPWIWNAGLGINYALDYIKIVVGQSFKPQFSCLV